MAVNNHRLAAAFLTVSAHLLQLGSHPFFRSLSGLRQNKVFDKATDVAEDVRQRWETSDSPLVLRLQVRLLLAGASSISPRQRCPVEGGPILSALAQDLHHYFGKLNGILSTSFVP